MDMSEVDNPPASTLDPDLKSMLEIDETDDKNFIYCATCSNVITKPAERTEVNGSHTHHFTNPHGIRFHVGCFANALGCDISGSGEAADTWFMGYVWHLASCSECHTHLGWYFSRSEHQFYGLIVDRIQEENG